MDMASVYSVKHHLIACASWILLISLAATGALAAVDDIICAKYAEIAAAQQKQNLASSCGFTGARWNADGDVHAAWCANAASVVVVEKENLIRAKKLDKDCDAAPVCKRQYSAAVMLNTIYVHDEADGSGNAEPYLWPVFFKVDDTAIAQLDAPLDHWVFGPGGEHKNLGTNSGNYWDAGDTINIPSSIGVWSTMVKNMIVKDQAVFGAIVVLLEEDDFPSSDSVKNEHYPKFRSDIATELRQIVVDSFLPDGEGGATTSVNVEQKIEQELKSELRENPGLAWDILFPLVHLADPFINIDDFIGVLVIKYSVKEIDELGALDVTINRRWHEGTGSEDGDFELHGRITAYPTCERS